MPDEAGSTLPALVERTISESEYRRLQKSGERVAELERSLAAAQARIDLLESPAGDLFVGLLPVLDSFSLAMASARARLDHAAILEGVELVEREMLRVLALHGVERLVVSPGDVFDWVQHETLDGLVVESALIDAELRAGYRRGNLVLRRSIVRLR